MKGIFHEITAARIERARMLALRSEIDATLVVKTPPEISDFLPREQDPAARQRYASILVVLRRVLFKLGSLDALAKAIRDGGPFVPMRVACAWGVVEAAGWSKRPPSKICRIFLTALIQQDGSKRGLRWRALVTSIGATPAARSAPRSCFASLFGGGCHDARRRHSKSGRASQGQSSGRFRNAHDAEEARPEAEAGADGVGRMAGGSMVRDDAKGKKTAEQIWTETAKARGLTKSFWEDVWYLRKRPAVEAILRNLGRIN